MKIWLFLTLMKMNRPAMAADSRTVLVPGSRNQPVLLTSASAVCFVVGEPGCGGTFTDTDGIIISPNWPNDYAHNSQCVYVIKLPAGEKVSLNFTHLSLENHSTCSFDYVEVGLDPGLIHVIKGITVVYSGSSSSSNNSSSGSSSNSSSSSKVVVTVVATVVSTVAAVL